MKNEQQSAAPESQQQGCCAARKALEETVRIERRYDLADRVRAVMDAVRPMFHIRDDETLPFIDRVNACELLRDGIANAIDGRATGREFRTLRHSWRAKHDPQHFPDVSDEDRRCQNCGAINPPAFSHCRDHRPALAAPSECDQLRAELQRAYGANSENSRLCLQADDECERLKSLCLRWNKMASHFTAGSEFIDDPERVGKALESSYRRQQGIHEAAEAQLRAQLAAKDALQTLQPLVGLEDRVAEWVRTRIGYEHMNVKERAMRLLEEAVELAQAEGIDSDSVARQVEHVYGRPHGEPSQEAAGVAVTLLGWCAATGNRMLDLALREIERIEAKPLDQIRGSLARKADADLVVCVEKPEGS